MPNLERIRELCSKVGNSQGEEFEQRLRELMNAIDLYLSCENAQDNPPRRATGDD